MYGNSGTGTFMVQYGSDAPAVTTWQKSSRSGNGGNCVEVASV